MDNTIGSDCGYQCHEMPKCTLAGKNSRKPLKLLITYKTINSSFMVKSNLGGT